MKKILLICTLFLVQFGGVENTEYDVTTAKFNLPKEWSFSEVGGM